MSIKGAMPPRSTQMNRAKSVARFSQTKGGLEDEADKISSKSKFLSNKFSTTLFDEKVEKSPLYQLDKMK